MSEKLCLKWNDFQENIKAAFGNCRGKQDFTDVTLVSEDGQQLEAHKVILAASSPFFQKLLERNRHSHPLVYLRGLKYDDLSAVVDFLYCGEANVYQENLDAFLAIAEEFQLKGLMGNNDENVKESQMPKFKLEPFKNNVDEIQRAHQNREGQNRESQNRKSQNRESQNRESQKKAEPNNTIALASNFSGNLEGLEEMVQSMMEKSPNNYAHGNWKADICKICGKEGNKSAIKNHIEVKHLEGLVLPCNQCVKIFRCRDSLRSHIKRDH